jgi:hypothetical protein
MKRKAMNMFAATNEDLPLFSGATVSVEVQEFQPVEVVPQCWITPEYSDDGMDGYFKGCDIHITPTTNGEYRVEVTKGLYGYWRGYADSIAKCHTFALTVIELKAGDF